ncbi:MAG: magnesium transporter [Myxococcota bacterium]
MVNPLDPPGGGSAGGAGGGSAAGGPGGDRPIVAGLDARTEGLLRRLLRREAESALRKLLARYRAEDIAAAMEHLTWTEQRRLYRSIEDKDFAAQVLTFLSEGGQREVTRDMSEEAVVDLLERVEPDDATDIVGSLPDALRAKVIEELEDDPTGEEVKNLLLWPPQSAGGIMSTQVLNMPSGSTCGQTIAELQAKHEQFEAIYYVYVVDAGGRLIGVCSLRDLLTHAPRTPVDKVMAREPIAVEPTTDQEEVARIVARYDLVAVPVIDRERRLLGIVTVDDVVDVIREEAAEDMMLMAGVSDPSRDRSLLRQAGYRAGWLLATVMGGILASEIVSAYQSTLTTLAVLAGFVPVIMGSGGNVGIQSATLAVRGLATGKVQVGGAIPFIAAEARVGLMLGVLFALILGLFGLFRYPDTPMLAVSVGSSVLFAMVLATLVGASLPIVLERLGIDPAIATGPFVTTGVDVFSILIYLNIATLLLT